MDHLSRAGVGPATAQGEEHLAATGRWPETPVQAGRTPLTSG